MQLLQLQALIVACEGHLLDLELRCLRASVFDQALNHTNIHTF